MGEHPHLRDRANVLPLIEHRQVVVFEVQADQLVVRLLGDQVEGHIIKEDCLDGQADARQDGVGGNYLEKVGISGGINIGE